MNCKTQTKDLIIEDNSTGYSLASKPDVRVRIFRSLEEVSTDWELAQPADNQFLHRPYLSVVEQYPPIGYEFAYLLFYRDNLPIGIAYCQLLEFKTSGTIRDEADNGAWTKFVQFMRGLVIDRISIKTLVCGNALLTGEHAFYFKSEIPRALQFSMLTDALRCTRREFEKNGEKFSGFFLKDFAKESLAYCQKFEEKGFHRVEFQPSMVMNIPQDWNTFDDYMAAFSAKYRTRAKRAFKKGTDIIKQEFNAERIRLHHKKIYSLYQNVEANAGFSFASLNKGYFCGLKENLGEDFHLTGYKINEELVGFYTTILNGKELEAHFLGFDPKLNRSHQLYLNMLYDMVRFAIDNNVERIVFARTALEIKSSVGAIAEEMHCYTRHWNDLPNRFIPKIFSYLNPIEEWTPRNPFK